MKKMTVGEIVIIGFVFLFFVNFIIFSGYMGSKILGKPCRNGGYIYEAGFAYYCSSDKRLIPDAEVNRLLYGEGD